MLIKLVALAYSRRVLPLKHLSYKTAHIWVLLAPRVPVQWYTKMSSSEDMCTAVMYNRTRNDVSHPSSGAIRQRHVSYITRFGQADPIRDGPENRAFQTPMQAVLFSSKMEGRFRMFIARTKASKR